MDHATSQVWAPILKIRNFRLHNRILYPKISLIAKFQLFIPFNKEVINIWLILGGILSVNGPRDVTGGPQFWRFETFDYTIEFYTPKISLIAKFQLFIPFNREVINIWLIWG